MIMMYAVLSRAVIRLIDDNEDNRGRIIAKLTQQDFINWNWLCGAVSDFWSNHKHKETFSWSNTMLAINVNAEEWLVNRMVLAHANYWKKQVQNLLGKLVQEIAGGTIKYNDAHVCKRQS